MSETTEKLLTEALQLSANERALLAAELIASIDGEPEDTAEAAWAAEIERRALRTRQGLAQASDWDSVRKRIERDLLDR